MGTRDPRSPGGRQGRAEVCSRQGRVPDPGPTQGSPLKQLRFSKEKGKMEKETEERKKKKMWQNTVPLVGSWVDRWVGGGRKSAVGAGRVPPLSVKCIMRHLHF